MPLIKRKSSILTAQELQFLASPSAKPQGIEFAVYSYKISITLDNCSLFNSDTLEQLLLMLSASPRGSAVILTEHCKSEAAFIKFLDLLKLRADIKIFWLGQMPGMDVELPAFEYCCNQEDLRQNIYNWQKSVIYIFQQWLTQYRIAFMTEKTVQQNTQHEQLEKIGAQNINYFDAQTSLDKIGNRQLLIIDLTLDGLRFVDTLNNLASREKFPILILFGKLPENICNAAYTLAKNTGFSILASLACIPDEKQWYRLLHSLFCKVYLKHWINKDPVKTGTYGIYDIDNHKLNSYFCLYGMTKKQIAALPEQQDVRKIISAHSLLNWFPDSIRHEIRSELAKDLNCTFQQIDICIENPEKIQTTSVLFAALVMASLSHFKIYWQVENERQFSSDILKNFPISDLLLSEKISHQLLTTPSEKLLDFIEQAKQQKIRLGVTLQQNKATSTAMALYGIEFVLNQQTYI